MNSKPPLLYKYPLPSRDTLININNLGNLSIFKTITSSNTYSGGNTHSGSNTFSGATNTFNNTFQFYKFHTRHQANNFNWLITFFKSFLMLKL